MSDLEDIRNWLKSVVGQEEPLEWEVTPQNLKYLKDLRSKNITKEKLIQVTVDETARLAREYEGELRRLDKILKQLGLDFNSLPGSANSYLQVLADSCVVLDEDNFGRGLEVALARAVLQHADMAPMKALARDKIEAVKIENLKLYSQLERLEESVKYADKEGEEDIEITKNQSKKLDFMTAKEKQYRGGLEKDELLNLKLTGGDKTLTHEHVSELSEREFALNKIVEDVRRNIRGYMNLPPSLDLASLEVKKIEAELENLTNKLDINIASVHL